VWNPEIDPRIFKQYSRRDLSGKIENKRFLVESLGLPFRKNVPLLATISRLTDQKGFDLIAKILEPLMQLEVQYVILGIGEKKYQTLLEKFAKKYADKLAVKLLFDDNFAHQIEAGADIFLMPSKFEPCGLNQLYSLKYGTIPIVRATGGLVDTINNFSVETGRGYGFVFEEYSGEALLKTIKRVLEIYQNEQLWKKMVDRAMRLNFSWQRVTEKFISLYYSLLK